MNRAALRAALPITLLSVLSLAVPTVALAAPASPVAAAPKDRDTVVTSFDGTKLQVHFFPADGLRAGDRAPVVFVAHGYGETGPASPTAPRLAGAATVPKLLAAGYDVLTWDARGHGSSGGTAMFDSPEFEVRDVKAIIDWVAEQPEVQLDAPGDPRMGMSGASYGGIIQYLTAAFDRRVDVITPGYTAYSLATTTITTYGKFKEGWAQALTAITTQTVLPGLTSPLGPYLHTPDPATISGLAGSTATGTLTPAFRTYLVHRSPSTYLHRVHIPTLVTGGTSDTLFPLMNAVRDFRYLKRHGVPVKLSWNCEGHSMCPGATGPLVKHFDSGVIGWFDRWLKGNRSADTGKPFSWIADNEDNYRSAGMFPPAVTGHLSGSGSGQLAIVPTLPSSPGFVLLGGQPADYSVDVPIKAPKAGADVLGFPRLTLTYSGTATPARTWLYAQVLDAVTGRVVGVQVTPVPVLLDGARHTLRLDLNAIATRATAASRYRLQLMPSSLIFGQQRSAGLVKLDKVSVALPIINAAAAPRLTVGRLSTSSRSVRAWLSAKREAFRSVHVVLSRRLASGRWAPVGGVAVGRVALSGRLATVGARLVPGRYLLQVRGIDAYDTAVTLRRTFVVRR